MIGDIECKKIILDDTIYEEMSKRFIALDTETTGLDCTTNVITEVGAVLFENGVPTKTFGSLVKINELVPAQITEITGITNEMLASAPKEEVVYHDLVEFLGDALDEKTIVVAHNASFDMGFIEHTLKRFGYIGVIRYADTLSLSRSLVKGLFNYKQDTVATYFNLVNEQAHRASTDAIICGKIMANLLNIYKTQEQTLDFNTKYDHCFDIKVKERGIIYYRFNLVNNYQEHDNTCSCTITGANTYKTKLELLDDTIKGECECLYYQDNKLNCKHMYALMLKYLSNKED